MRGIAQRQGDNGEEDRFHATNAPLSAFERQPYLSGEAAQCGGSEVRISDRRERIRTFGIGTLAYADRMTPANSDRKQHEALKDLERLNHEGDLITGLLRQTTAPEADKADPIERWGRRIGRTLAAVAFLAFCVYLYLTYVR